jgi:hypothetical protein
LKEVLIWFVWAKLTVKVKLTVGFNLLIFRFHPKWILYPLASGLVQYVKECPVNINGEGMGIVHRDNFGFAKSACLGETEIYEFVSYSYFSFRVSNVNEHLFVQDNLGRIINWYLLVDLNIVHAVE